MIHNKKGSTLYLMLSILFVLAIVGTSAMNLTMATTDLYFKKYHKTKIHLEAEGMLKAFSRLAQTYIENTSSMTMPLKDYIDAKMSTLTPSDYSVVSWNVTTDASPTTQNLPGGPFKGMQSSTTAVHFELGLKEISSGMQNTATLDGLIAGISFTQFASFSFRDLYIFGSIPTVLDGRIHANNLVCIGAAPAQVRAITSAGVIQHTTQCYNFSTPKNAFVSFDGTMPNLRELLPNATSGCTNCDGSGTDWAAYAINRWNGNVQDASHGVPKLELKYAGTPAVQSRQLDVSGTLQVDQQNPERFLIDPPLASDSPSIQDLKFAQKADIRIINGVWYIKDPSNAANWPGIPVWSDHPGHFNAFAEEGVVPAKGFTHANAAGVGQEDIRTWLTNNGTPNQWTAGTVPQKFSYYPWNSSTQTLGTTGSGVISYGGLAKMAANKWVPGQFVANHLAGKSALCSNAGAVCTNCGTPNNIRNYTSQVTCGSGNNPTIAANVLNSARTGFRFHLWEYFSMPISARQAQSKILPVNFDLDAFQKALGCTFNPLNPTAPGVDHPGELGCYFTTWGLVGRPFNGIVYITNTWKGSMDNLVKSPPFNLNDVDANHAGNNADSTQISASHAAVHQSLPFELCSDDPAFIGRNMDGTGLFKIPDCANYNESTPSATPIRTRASWVRIVNAKTIDSAILPRGVSIISNMQVFMVGDVNADSNTAVGGLPWSPVLLGGDQVVPLSNSWTDDYARWDVAANANPVVKTASNTTYNLAMLSGQGTLFMFNENWLGKTLKFRGPAIQPYDAIDIYMKNTFSNATGTFQYPTRDSAYDSHYEFILNQPPGVPVLSLFAVTSWL